MPQFTFLAAEFADIHALAAKAEGMARTDAREACVHARIAFNEDL